MTCKRCNGSGWVWYEDDPSPAGVSLSPGTMTFCDPCPDCLDKGICPRCGEVIDTEVDEDCRCGHCLYSSEEAYEAGPTYPEIDDPYHGQDMPDWEPEVEPAEIEEAVRVLLGRTKS